VGLGDRSFPEPGVATVESSDVTVKAVPQHKELHDLWINTRLDLSFADSDTRASANSLSK
jgi:hypothetical protein